MSALDPVEPVVRNKHATQGDLLHIDIKTLGRITTVGQRITGNPCDRVPGVGYGNLFVAVDEHSCVAYTDMQSTERKECAIAFLQAAVAYYVRLEESL